MGEMDVAVLVVHRRLFELAQRIARHPAADILIADLSGQEGRGFARHAAGRLAQLPQHRVLDELQDLVQRLALVVMRVDVDDQHVVEAALIALARRVGEKLVGVEFLDAQLVVTVATGEVHCVCLYCQ